VYRNSILSLIKSEPVDRGFAISNLRSLPSASSYRSYCSNLFLVYLC
jgi:hypothetical protein